MRDTSSIIDCTQPVEWGHPLNTGLIAWYLCHPQLAGTGRLFDLCNTGNLARAGTLTGMAAPYTSATSGWRQSDRQGGFGVTIAADGTDDYVTASVPPVSGLSRAFICGWIRRPSAGVENVFGLGSSSSSARFNIIWFSDNTIYFQSCGSGTAYRTLARNVTGWHWLGMEFTPSATTWNCYYDGVLVTTGSGGGTTSSTLTGAGVTDLWIGREVFHAYSQGQYDDIRLYNRALSAAEVAALYQSSSTQYPGVLRRMRNVSYSFPGAAAAATDAPRALFFGAI